MAKRLKVPHTPCTLAPPKEWRHSYSYDVPRDLRIAYDFCRRARLLNKSPAAKRMVAIALCRRIYAGLCTRLRRRVQRQTAARGFILKGREDFGRAQRPSPTGLCVFCGYVVGQGLAPAAQKKAPLQGELAPQVTEGLVSWFPPHPPQAVPLLLIGEGFARDGGRAQRPSPTTIPQSSSSTNPAPFTQGSLTDD